MSFTRWFDEQQIPPQPGEVIVGCGHASHAAMTVDAPEPGNGWNWAEVIPPVVMPDPSSLVAANLESRWIATCDACLAAAGGDVLRVEIREHWRIGEPQEDRLRRYAQARFEAMSDRELIEAAARVRRRRGVA